MTSFLSRLIAAVRIQRPRMHGLVSGGQGTLPDRIPLPSVAGLKARREVRRLLQRVSRA